MDRIVNEQDVDRMFATLATLNTNQIIMVHCGKEVPAHELIRQPSLIRGHGFRHVNLIMNDSPVDGLTTNIVTFRVLKPAGHITLEEIDKAMKQLEDFDLNPKPIMIEP